MTRERPVKSLGGFNLPRHMLTLRTLGKLELTGADPGGAEVRRKPLALLACLARHAPRPVSRAELAELLWGGLGDDGLARQSLRQALSVLRSAVGDRLHSDAERVRLALDDFSTDAHDFESDVAGRRWAAAVAHWGGDFLAGMEDAGGETWRAWIESERVGLRRKASLAFENLVAASESAGDWDGAVRWSEQWMQALPSDARACLKLVSTLQGSGRLTEAAARQAVCVETLRHRGVDVPPELVRLGKQLDRERPDPVLGPRGFVSPDLVGRVQAFTRLSEAWSRACRGVGTVVVVSADDGLGKTRLLEEFCRVARQQDDATIMEERAFAAERNRRYGLLRAVLARLADVPGLAGTPPATLAALAEVAPILAERFRKLPTADTAPDLAEHFHRALSDVAADGPLLLVIDDAADADVESADCLAMIVRRPPPGTLLILSERPPANHASPLGAAMATPAAHIEQIELGPLTADQIRALVSSMAPLTEQAAAELTPLLLQESEGNPAQVVVLMRLLADRGLLAVDDAGRWYVTRRLEPGDFTLTDAARDALRLRLDTLSPDARRLAEAAAVAGPRADAVLLEAVAGLPPDAFGSALGELLAMRLLRQRTGGASGYHFVSDASRRAMYELIAPSRRRELHRAAARALRDHGGAASGDAVAFHRREGQQGRWRVGRAAGIVGAGAAVVVAVMGTVAQLRAPSPPVRTQILLADVENLAGDSVLARALHAAAMVALRESRSIAVFSRAHVSETLRRMQITRSDTFIGEPLAREIALREGLNGVVTLSIAQLGGTYVLTVRAVDPASGRDLWIGHRRVGAREELLSALDGLTGDLRRRFGESGVVVAAARSLPRVTTASLEALRAFSDGQRAWERRDYHLAHDAFRRAAAIDTGFALAHAALADLYFQRMNDPIEGNAALDRALAFFDRLSDREQLELRLRVARFRGPAAEELRLAQLLAESFPDRDTWYNRGTVLMRHRRCGEAIPALQAALAFDSLFTGAHMNIATCRQFLGDYHGAVDAYAAAHRTDSTVLFSGNLNNEWGQALLRVRGPAAAESVFLAMSRRPAPQDRAFGARSLAYLAMYRGRYHEAMRHLDSAIVHTRAAGTALSEYRNNLLLAVAAVTAGDTAAAERAVTRGMGVARRISMAPGFLAFAAHAYARLGERGALRELKQRSEAAATPGNEADRSMLALIDAHALYVERRYPELLVRLDDARDTVWNVWTRTLRAEALHALGQTDSAITVLEPLTRTLYFGYEVQDEWRRALLRLGRWLEERGRVGEAQAAYSAFVAQLAEADDDLPDLREARAALSRLGRGDAATDQTVPARRPDGASEGADGPLGPRRFDSALWP